MGELIDSIGKNFERLLRWVYPGALFLVLLRLSNPDAFDHLACRNLGIGLWGLVVGGLVAGFVIYLFQGYVINYIVTFVFMRTKWDVRQGCQVKPPEIKKEDQPVNCLWLRSAAPVFDRMAEATRKRWGGSVPRDLQNYLNYMWAAYHAVMMTGWLTWVFFFVSISGSDSIFPWVLTIPATLLLFGGILTYALLTRMRLEDP